MLVCKDNAENKWRRKLCKTKKAVIDVEATALREANVLFLNPARKKEKERICVSKGETSRRISEYEHSPTPRRKH